MLKFVSPGDIVIRSDYRGGTSERVLMATRPDLIPAGPGTTGSQVTGSQVTSSQAIGPQPASPHATSSHAVHSRAPNSRATHSGPVRSGPVRSGPVRSGAGGYRWPAPPDSLFEGFTGADTPWRPTRPFIIRQATFDHLCALTWQGARLVLAACQRRARTAGELREALGVPAEHVPLLDPGEPLGEHLLAAIRPDLVTESGQPKNIEASIGGPPHVDRLAPRFFALYQGTPAAEACGLQPPRSAQDARSRSIRAHLGLDDGAFLVMPAFDVGGVPGVAGFRRFAQWQEPGCASGRRHGLDMITFPLEQFRTDKHHRLLADGRPVDAILRMFDTFSQPASPGLDALTEAVRAGTVRMYTSEATTLLSNKTVLAWLWQDADQLAAADREFVHRHIPWTVPLPRAGLPGASLSGALAGQDRLVLKPAGGYGGTGVTVGPAVPAATWRAVLDRAAAEGGYILQELVDGDVTELDFTHRDTGETHAATVKFVLGPFLFSGEAAGVFVRHGTPDSGPVINAALGAFPNTGLLAGRDAEGADLAKAADL
jgi:hypothetical protein